MAPGDGAGDPAGGGGGWEAEYLSYLGRFEASVGAVAIGAYGKFGGHLIRKLTLEEFAVRRAEYEAFHREFEQTVMAGMTLRSSLIRQLRERAAELVLPRPT